MPHAMEVIKQLKDMGIKTAVCSNSNTPLKRIKVLESLGFNIEGLFDAFIVSGDYGVRKPNPDLIQIVKDKFPEIQNHEMFIIGDQIDRDIACGHLAGIRSVFFAYRPYNPAANYKAFALGEHPDFSILDFRQLPYILEIMNHDVKFIE